MMQHHEEADMLWEDEGLVLGTGSRQITQQKRIFCNG